MGKMDYINGVLFKWDHKKEIKKVKRTFEKYNIKIILHSFRINNNYSSTIKQDILKVQLKTLSGILYFLYTFETIKQWNQNIVKVRTCRK